MVNRGYALVATSKSEFPREHSYDRYIYLALTCQSIKFLLKANGGNHVMISVHKINTKNQMMTVFDI